MTDALTYAVIQNIISSNPNKRSAWESSRWDNYQDDLDAGSGEVPRTVSDLLTQTTIKRACCMGKTNPGDPRNPCPECYTIKVSIPILKDFDENKLT